jgi:hypothetical protein
MTMKMEQFTRRLISLQAASLVIVMFIAGTILFPATEGSCAGGSDMLIASAAAPTQPKVKTDGASAVNTAKTYTEESIEKLFEGKGIGKKTLSAVCKEYNIDLNLAKKKLAKQNIKMKDDETLFDAAQKVSKTPIDMIKIILKGEPIKK